MRPFRTLLDRTHFRVVREAPEGQVREYLAHREQLEEGLRETVGSDRFYLDGAARELATETELDFPVVQDDEVVSRWEDESPLFRTLPPLGYFRLYVGGDDAVVERARDVWSQIYGTGSTESN